MVAEGGEKDDYRTGIALAGAPRILIQRFVAKDHLVGFTVQQIRSTGMENDTYPSKIGKGKMYGSVDTYLVYNVYHQIGLRADVSRAPCALKCVTPVSRS